MKNPTMTAAEIRESFLKYFESHRHQRIKSASLIPQNDPTLFFTNAGMVPFKNVFTGEEKLGTQRAISSQKCMRVSGKHNDLENVGRTLRHHTFFEMLGNFSFGDYFKKEAIKYAWEYLTEILKIDKAHLWVTVFESDEEAEGLWLKHTDVAKDRILRMDEKDNFWSMGPTGPCGPCSEIHFDHGKEFGCDKPNCAVGCDCDRYMEIWNLVFMQFDRGADGRLTPLPKPSVDTGMGLERLACVVQGVHSNYDSDLFTPLLKKISEISGVPYGQTETTDVSLRVMADHIRASAFLVSDGVLPSNEGRGYVLRRIMRRGIRHGRLLGVHGAFFYKIVPTLTKQMRSAYPELKNNQKFIEEVIKTEEERFLETLEKGLEIIQSEIGKAKKAKHKQLSGALAFKLYDTFGFPLDLSETIAAESDLTIDHDEFKKHMSRQKETARAAWKGSGEEKIKAIYSELLDQGITTQFLGYQSLECRTKVTKLLKQGRPIKSASPGEKIEAFFEASPFYAESGGQVGDQGEAFHKNTHAKITDTQSPLPGVVVHYLKIETGTIKVGDEIQLKVYSETRRPTMLNHTATHLLHAALREILGEHVKQAGSLVEAARLRFDFSHHKALSREEIQALEDRVNEKIREDIEVQKSEMTYDEAIAAGALAFFGEKYGEKVRVLKVADFSTELCGGTHVDRTGEIGSFKIVSESSVAAGVRRIEAITGEATIKYVRELEQNWNQLAQQLKVAPDEILMRIQKQTEQVKKQERELSKLKTQLASGGAQADKEDWKKDLKEIKGIKILCTRRDLDDMKALRSLSDQLIQKLNSGILILASSHENKVTLIARVSKDLTKTYQAGTLVKELAPLIGGSGGGRPDMAQAGGGNVEGIKQVFSKVSALI